MRRTLYVNAAGWLIFYAALWYLLTGGSGWLFALPVLLICVGMTAWLQLTPGPLRITRLPPFIAFFLAAMVSGAWDVARRALHPRCPLQPGWLYYPLKSQNPHVHLLCSALVGLLPGTLVAEVQGDPRSGERQLHVHVLDQHQPHQQKLAELERQLDRLLT